MLKSITRGLFPLIWISWQMLFISKDKITFLNLEENLSYFFDRDFLRDRSPTSDNCADRLMEVIPGVLSLRCKSLYFHPCISKSLRFRIPAFSIPAFFSLQTLIPAFFNSCILQIRGNFRWYKFKLWVFLTFEFNIIRSHKLLRF